MLVLEWALKEFKEAEGVNIGVVLGSSMPSPNPDDALPNRGLLHPMVALEPADVRLLDPATMLFAWARTRTAPSGCSELLRLHISTFFFSSFNSSSPLTLLSGKIVLLLELRNHSVRACAHSSEASLLLGWSTASFSCVSSTTVGCYGCTESF